MSFIFENIQGTSLHLLKRAYIRQHEYSQIVIKFNSIAQINIKIIICQYLYNHNNTIIIIYYT